MDVNAISSLISGGTGSQGTSGTFGKDTFLKLLTTQMQNQDPMSPASNEEFLAQLAQFSSLEQLMGIQEALDALTVGMASMTSASMVNVLGANVIARGNTFSYDGDGGHDLLYNLPEDARSATVIVRDAEGRVVDSWDVGALESGEGTVTWDGQTLQGRAAEAGTYSFEIQAFDEDGEPIDVEHRVSGIVDEMDYSTGSPRPSLDGVPISLGDIVRLRVDAD